MSKHLLLIRFTVAFIGMVGIQSTCAAAENIFADGFDGSKWYIDADLDGYGDPDSFVHDANQPSGYVANALDCNDADPNIHPGAPDDPDAGFIDSNCDGIDGTISKAIFVAPTGTDDPSCGTMASPCRMPSAAIERLDVEHTQIYLQTGIYEERLDLYEDVAFYGGYDAQWQRSAVTAAGPNTTLQGTYRKQTSGPGIQSQGYVVYLTPSASASFTNVEIRAPRAPVRGKSSYALYAGQGSSLLVLRSRIVQGDGEQGASGISGVNAAQTPSSGARGSPGRPGKTQNQCSTYRETGGQAGTNTCGWQYPPGGMGGDGGSADTFCPTGIGTPNYSATRGQAGRPGYANTGYYGRGGYGGGSAPGPGGTGSVNHGSDGDGGYGWALKHGLWVASNGDPGTIGSAGGGGGGGGGADGEDAGTDSSGASGGGGGAGGCQAPAAGTGGQGGGASIGIFTASGVTLVAADTTFLLGSGGDGGDGGDGGLGQPGGDGGSGGLAAYNGKTGGPGGVGGQGGNSGAGGKGQGGGVYGLLLHQSTTCTCQQNTFVGGIAGQGGQPLVFTTSSY